MTGARRVAFAVGCMLCLLAVTAALPAADPRLDPPGGDSAGAGDWESVASSSDPASDVIDDSNDTDDAGDDDGERRSSSRRSDEIEIDGPVEPGREVAVTIAEGGFFTEVEDETVAINGEEVGMTDEGEIDVTVPYAEEMNVSVPAEDRSRTVDVPTAASIETADGAAPARDLEVAAAVGATPVADATVRLDGEAVATTDDEGTATVSLPESAGPVDLTVERGAVSGNATIDVVEPTVEFTSPLAFPGMPAPVQVSADGVGVADATVSLADGETVRTDEDGRARLWLPIDDEATVTAEVGAETATATIGDLYLRLAAVVVLVPGFLIGGTVTYFRYVAAAERRRRRRLSGLVLALADGFAALADGLRGLTVSRPSLPRPSLSWPGVSLPRLRFGGLPSLEMPSFGGSFPSLPSLSLDSLAPSSDRATASPFRGGDTDDEEETSDGTAPQLASEPAGPRGPRTEVRAAWHAFVDRLGVDDRSTRTPGQVARRAVAAGFPAATVRRLLTLFRDVEYGDREPSPDRVREARAAAEELGDHDAEEGSE